MRKRWRGWKRREDERKIAALNLGAGKDVQRCPGFRRAVGSNEREDSGAGGHEDCIVLEVSGSQRRKDIELTPCDDVLRLVHLQGANTPSSNHREGCGNEGDREEVDGRSNRRGALDGLEVDGPACVRDGVSLPSKLESPS